MQELSASAQNPTPLTRYLDRSLMKVREQRNKGRMMPPRFLRKDEFSFIVRHAPLVSIDLIIRDPEENVLVGLRANEPARGMPHNMPEAKRARHNENIRAALAEDKRPKPTISKITAEGGACNFSSH